MRLEDITMLDILKLDNPSLSRLLESDECPDELIEDIQDTMRYRVYYQTRMAMAKSHKISIEHLDRLSRDEEVKVRLAVAENEICPIEILERLSRDENDDVRRTVAKHPNMPLEILYRMAKDSKTSTSAYKACQAKILACAKEGHYVSDMESYKKEPERLYY